MQVVTYWGKPLMVGNDAATALMAYAASLATTGNADSVTLTGIGEDGDEVDATMLVGQGCPLIAESTRSGFPEPDNAHVTADIRSRTSRLSDPEPIPHEDPWPGSPVYFDFSY
jgi:hypothetical protein